jgi:hypothetical protein
MIPSMPGQKKISRPEKPGSFSWTGAVVLVLALCLGVGWATALIMSASARTPPIAGETGDLLNSVGGVLAGAITAYIGGMIAIKRRHKDDDDADDDDDDDDVGGDDDGKAED